MLFFWMILQQRIIWKKPIVNWLFDLTLKKNKHPQDSATFYMINKAKGVLEYVLCHNNAMRRTKEREEGLQRQEESWIEDKQISKSQE